MTALNIAPPAGDGELVRFGEIAARSLGFAVERAPPFLSRVGARHVRLARIGGEVVGGLALLPMGHWFGGRRVACAGVTAVAVSPEHRSRGVATKLTRAALEEMGRDKVPLSSLFPSTFPVYRAAGYETAGNRVAYRLPLASLGRGASEPEVRVACTAQDHGILRTLYDARSRFLSGAIDRSPYFWQRVLEPWGEEAKAFLVEGKGGPEGYLVLSFRPTPGAFAPNDLPVRDAVARTPAAARRILRLLADHRSIYRSATLASGPGDAMLLSMQEERLEVAELHRWMLRIVDVRAALLGRGWHAAVRGEVHLEVKDALLQENARRWVLTVAGGAAEVREGGTGAMRIEARGLAALYSGYLPAEELRAAGLCDGSDADLACATALFAGPAPWAADFF